MKHELNGPTILSYQCPVTGKIWKSNEIAIPTRLCTYPRWKNQQKITHAGLRPCPEVQDKFNDGYIALIVIDTEKSLFNNSEEIKAKNACKTGTVFYMKKDRVEDILEINVDKRLIVFIDKEIATKLEKLCVKTIEK